MIQTRPRLALVYDRIYPLMNGGGERRFYEIGRRLAHEFEVGFFYYGQGAAPLDYPLVAKRVKASLVITWHEYWGTYWSQYLPAGLALVARGFERSIPRLASANIAVSSFTARRLQAGSGAVAHVVPNGIDVTAISKASPAAKPTDIVFIGRLIKEKRVDLLLSAVGKVAPSVPFLQVEVIGDGPEKHTVDELVRELPANVRVDLVPRVADESELYACIKAAKMLVLPSEREGYGLVVAEAQACGTVPVVLHGRDNASVDLIENGETGIIAEANANRLADAIGVLLSDTDLRLHIGQKARALSTVRDWDYCAAQMSSLFRTLVVNKSTQHAHIPGVVV